MYPNGNHNNGSNIRLNANQMINSTMGFVNSVIEEGIRQFPPQQHQYQTTTTYYNYSQPPMYQQQSNRYPPQYPYYPNQHVPQQPNAPPMNTYPSHQPMHSVYQPQPYPNVHYEHHHHHQQQNNHCHGHPVSDSEFVQILNAIKKATFSSNKIQEITSIAKHNFFTCQQVKSIIKDTLDHSSDKVQALRLLAPKIVDRGNSRNIVDAFVFMSDQQTAREILGL